MSSPPTFKYNVSHLHLRVSYLQRLLRAQLPCDLQLQGPAALTSRSVGHPLPSAPVLCPHQAQLVSSHRVTDSRLVVKNRASPVPHVKVSGRRQLCRASDVLRWRHTQLQVACILAASPRLCSQGTLSQGRPKGATAPPPGGLSSQKGSCDRLVSNPPCATSQCGQ